MAQTLSRSWHGFARLFTAASALALASCGGGSQDNVAQTFHLADNAGMKIQAATAEAAADQNLLPWVNPFIGTKIGNPSPDNQGTGGAVGNTFPGATLPFGMVQFSPDTGYGEFYAFGGYNYDKGVLQGMSLVHSSGTGCTIQQDISMMPIVGNITVSPGTHIENYQVGFSHANEQAVPGYYRVGLNNGVNTEMTVTRRTGFGRFTWPATNDATMILNTGRNGVGARSAQLEIVGNDAVQGFVETGGVCGGGGYFVYFYGQFDKSFSSFGTYSGDTITAGSRTAARGKNNGGWVKFAGGGQVRLRIGVSYVSTANAKLNMQTENPSWDFDGLKASAQATWNSTLNKVQVTGGSNDDRTKFYTALYHSLLHPNLFSDVNNQYIGFDNKIYSTGGGWDKYATFSGWDIYRSQVQLIGWLSPKVASDMAQSMVVDAQMGGGGYPKWPTANDDTCVMVGDAGAVIVANLYAFGGTSFDTTAALGYMEKAATQPGTRSRNCETRPGLSEYLSRGYIPMGTSGVWGPSATTLEFALADSAIGQFAGALGNTAKRDQYFTKAQAWKTLYSNNSGYIHPRDTGGSFKNGFDRAVDGGDFVEGNSAQYTWMVPQNYRGLIDHMGGNAAAIARLDEHFTKLDAGPSSPYAFMGNEPEHGSPWAYNFAGAPYKTQQVVRRILTDLYRNGADGLTGNDDLGATSAWFVWGALGLYPEIPGLGGFTIGSPLFPTTVVRMGNGRTLTINASNAGANGTYIQSLKVNGATSTSTWLPLTRLTSDTTLDFVLGSTANTSWGSAPGDAPPSFDAPRTGTRATSFSSDFESLAAQPDWNDTVDFQANVGGYCCGLNHMETSVRRENVAHSGSTALMYSGLDNDATRSFSYNKVFDVNIAVNNTTKLSYWIHPQGGSAHSRYVAVDLIFSDGSSLRDSGATDQNGVRVHPELQGRGGRLVNDQWNNVQSNIGQWMAGKTIVRILVAYDQPGATGNFRGYIDDIQITP
jgi:predicted alpha-1,2-mannosidase